MALPRGHCRDRRNILDESNLNPNFLPDENSTAIIIAANTGRITQFRLANLSFKYTSTPSQSVGFVDPNVAHYLLAYYLLFLFITPVAAVILVTRVFKTEN